MKINQKIKGKRQKLLFFLLFLLFTLNFLFNPSQILSLEPISTSSTDPLRPPSREAGQSESEASLKSKLKTLQDEIASKAAQFKVEITKKLQNKAYIGIIKSKAENAFFLNTFSGDKTVTINDYTIYSGKGKPSFKTFAIGDNIAALGDVDDKEVLTAKKIFKLDSVQEEKKAVAGSVISIKDSVLNLQTKNNQGFSLLTSQNTSYQLSQNKISFGDIKVGRSVVAIGIGTKDNQIKARFIYLLPGAGVNIKPQITTSSSTPSATIKPTKTSK